MKTKFFPLLLIAMIFVSQSCFHPYRIEGNCNVVTVNRSIGEFTGVDSHGSLDVRLINDSVCFVEIEGESNLIPYVDTDISNGILQIEVQGWRNLDPNYPLIIYVHAPSINHVELSGSGSIVSDSLSASHMDIRLSGSGDIHLKLQASSVDAKISGSGDINLEGAAALADFRISGSGDIYAYSFPVNECIADISGSGSMYVNVSSLLDVVISGSGNVHYYGNPAVNVHVFGSGQVIHH